MGRGRKPEFYLCGYTQVLLFYEKKFLNRRNFVYYNELMEDLPRMRVEWKMFENYKRGHHKRLSTK